MRYADAPELMTASWYVTRTLIIRFGFIGIAVFAVTNGILHSSCVPVLGYALLEIASSIGLWWTKFANILIKLRTWERLSVACDMRSVKQQRKQSSILA